MKIKADHALTLIIDDQIKLLPSIANAEQMLQNTCTLLSGLRLLEIPMLITQQYTKGLGMTDQSIFHHSGVMDYEEKITFSCFQDETIRRKIQSSGRNQTSGKKRAAPRKAPRVIVGCKR